MKIPPHMPPEQAQMLMQFLRSNPDAAKQVFEQAKVMMKSPAMANAFLNLQVCGSSACPDYSTAWGQCSTFRKITDH
jgi:hypothetical protein